MILRFKRSNSGFDHAAKTHCHPTHVSVTMFQFYQAFKKILNWLKAICEREKSLDCRLTIIIYACACTKRKLKERVTCNGKQFHLKRPRKLLVRDQSTRPTQLPIKNGKDIHEGWLIPTTSWTAGSSKQQVFLAR